MRAFVHLCPLMDGMQTPPGTTECNHSYFSGNSFSVPHSAQQLQHGTPATPAQSPASIQEVNVPASSGVISISLLSCSAFSSQVTVDPTRYGTGDDMPLAEAITQLSFLEFLQRCGVPIAPHQPSQPPVSISLQDATVQTTPLCDVSHQVSTQTSVQQDTLSCDVAVQTSFYGAHTLSLDAAAQTTSPSTLSQHVSTQMGSRSASSFSVDTSVQTPRRCVVLHDAATQLPLTEFLIGWIFSNSPLDRQNLVRQSPPPMQGSHALPQPPPGLEQPLSLSLLLIRICSLHMVRMLTVLPAMPSSRLSVPLMWEHTLYVQPLAPRGVQVPRTREPTTLLAQIFVQTQDSSPNQKQSFFPWSVLGNPSPTDPAPLPQKIAISCIINFAFPSYSGIQARRAEILPTLSLLPVVGSMQLSFRKPATMSRTSQINSEHTPTTRTLLSCSTRTPLSQTPQFSRSRPTLRAKVRGAWYYSLFAPCCVASLFLAHLQSHFARYTSTMLWPRNVMHPLSFSSSFMPNAGAQCRLHRW